MSKLKSAIYGLAVGDALGVPFEFANRCSFNCKDMVGYRTHNQPPGTWSDDTSMTLATCASIKENNKKINIKDIRKRFENWIFEGEYTANGDVFDYGITTINALSRGKGYFDINSNGNGSLMRILPLAFVNASDNEINKVSAITHGHEISIEGCRIYVAIARKLLKGKNLKEILSEIEVSEVYSSLRTLDGVGENDIKSTGYVVDTLEASLWCILKTDNYRSAVLKAVNLGDDTDTVGAVTGGLAGIIYGYEDIPKEWISVLQNKEEINKYLF